jgi:large subunit ribosomal protein L9
MELILLKDVENVGKKGDVVRAREGYARNFLIPRKLALVSTRSNQQFFAEQKERVAKRRIKEKGEAEKRAKDLEQVQITLEAASGEQGKLFGSVTSDEIRVALAGKGYTVDKKRIHLKEPIRALGTHSVSVELYPQVKATVTVEVVRKP